MRSETFRAWLKPKLKTNILRFLLTNKMIHALYHKRKRASIRNNNNTNNINVPDYVRVKVSTAALATNSLVANSLSSIYRWGGANSLNSLVGIVFR